jgi:protein-S-isoprenylcysteine O-methyltransferase Ste14
MSDGMSLKSKLMRRAFIGLLSTPGILFISAGSLKFWQGWAFLALMLPLGVGAGIYFYRLDPKLLERRLLTREKVGAQKIIIKLVRALLVFSLCLSGLDYRFGWSRAFPGPVPLWLTVLSLAVVLGCYLLIIWVISVNRFAASVIQVEAGQAVVSTGPYRVVRHPMYLVASVMFLFLPLALGSYFALPAFAVLIPLLVLRLLNEEKVLGRELPGYAEYCLRTRFRLIPLVW